MDALWQARTYPVRRPRPAPGVIAAVRAQVGELRVEGRVERRGLEGLDHFRVSKNHGRVPDPGQLNACSRARGPCECRGRGWRWRRSTASRPATGSPKPALPLRRRAAENRAGYSPKAWRGPRGISSPRTDRHRFHSAHPGRWRMVGGGEGTGPISRHASSFPGSPFTDGRRQTRSGLPATARAKDEIAGSEGSVVPKTVVAAAWLKSNDSAHATRSLAAYAPALMSMAKQQAK